MKLESKLKKNRFNAYINYNLTGWEYMFIMIWYSLEDLFPSDLVLTLMKFSPTNENNEWPLPILIWRAEKSLKPAKEDFNCHFCPNCFLILPLSNIVYVLDSKRILTSSIRVKWIQSNLVLFCS